MARREGAPLQWTPNTLVEQHIHHNTIKMQQTGRQIHPPLWDKDGNLQPHSPWMVHFVLEDHRANWKGTKVQLTHNLARTYLQNTIPLQMPSSRTAQPSNPHTDYDQTRRAGLTRCIPGPNTATYPAPRGTQTPPGTNPYTEKAYPDKAGPNLREAPHRETEQHPPTL